MRSKRPGSATSAPRRGPSGTSAGEAPSAARGAASGRPRRVDRRRLDDHAAAREEPVPDRRAQLRAQGAGVRASPACSRRCWRSERILEIYLNSVEWGEGVFGAEAAARHYFRIGAGALAPLAVGAARGHAAGAQALREATAFGLCRRPRRDDRRADGAVEPLSARVRPSRARNGLIGRCVAVGATP